MKQLILFLLLLGAIASRSDAQQVRHDTPQIARVAQQFHRDTLIVYFAFDRYDSATETDRWLNDRLSDSAIASTKLDSIRIIGHTDLHGSEEYNLALSRRRAQFIRSQFGRLRSAWPSTIYRMAAMGKLQPVSKVDSINRRVEIVFYSHPASSLSPPRPEISSHAESPPYPEPTVHLESPPHPEPASPLAGPPDTSNHPTNIDTVFTLTQIYFIENTPLFTEASQQALPSVMSYLKKYKNRIMRVLGYVNSPGELLDKNDHLFILSTKRAQAVYSYMISDGFDSRRLTYQGMGNSVMIKPHPMSLSEMRENMRVVIEVDKE